MREAEFTVLPYGDIDPEFSSPYPGLERSETGTAAHAFNFPSIRATGRNRSQKIVLDFVRIIHLVYCRLLTRGRFMRRS
jgi:hypothetical protein